MFAVEGQIVPDRSGEKCITMAASLFVFQKIRAARSFLRLYQSKMPGIEF